MSHFKRVEDAIFFVPQPIGKNLQDTRRQGIRTVIDFRLPSKLATFNEKLTKSQGLAYVKILADKAAHLHAE